MPANNKIDVSPFARRKFQSSGDIFCHVGTFASMAEKMNIAAVSDRVCVGFPDVVEQDCAFEQRFPVFVYILSDLVLDFGLI